MAISIPNVRQFVPKVRPINNDVAQTFSVIQDALDLLATNASSSATSSTGTTTVSASNLRQLTLTGPTTVTSGIASPSPNSILVVELTQDATGGRTITWAAEFASDTPTQVSELANKVSRYWFVYIGTTWRLVAAPYLQS